MKRFFKLIWFALFILPVGFAHAGGDNQRCPICLEDGLQVVLHRVARHVDCRVCEECAQRMFAQHEPCDVAAYKKAVERATVRAMYSKAMHSGAGTEVINVLAPCNACSQGDTSNCKSCRHCNRQCPLCTELLTADDVRNICETAAPIAGASSEPETTVAKEEKASTESGEPAATVISDGSAGKRRLPYLLPTMFSVVVGGMTIAATVYLVWKHRQQKKKKKNNCVTRTHRSEYAVA